MKWTAFFLWLMTGCRADAWVEAGRGHLLRSLTFSRDWGDCLPEDRNVLYGSRKRWTQGSLWFHYTILCEERLKEKDEIIVLKGSSSQCRQLVLTIPHKWFPFVGEGPSPTGKGPGGQALWVGPVDGERNDKYFFVTQNEEIKPDGWEPVNIGLVVGNAFSILTLILLGCYCDQARCPHSILLTSLLTMSLLKRGCIAPTFFCFCFHLCDH